MAKATDKWLRDLNDARAVIDGLEVDERLRATLHRAIAESMVAASDRLQDMYERRNEGVKWTQQDYDTIAATLADVAAPTSWGEERIILDMLATRLGRPEKIVKKKAIELGYGSKVDYWSNPKNKDA